MFVLDGAVFAAPSYELDDRVYGLVDGTSPGPDGGDYPCLSMRPILLPALSDGTVNLRAFSSADASAVAAALEDGEISRWTATIPWPYTEDDAQEWISSHEQRRQSGDGLDLAITERGDVALGAIGLDGFDWNARRGLLGYWMGRPSRNRGLTTRAVILVSDWALATLDLDCIQLFTMRGNAASERVAAKAGFRVAEVIHDRDFGSKRATVSRWERARSNAQPSA